MDVNEILSKLLDQFTSQLFALLIPLVVMWVIAKGKEVWEMFKVEQPKLAAVMEQGIDLAVDAAEAAGLFDLTLDKMKYACDYFENWLFITYKLKIETEDELELIKETIEGNLLWKHEEFDKIAEKKRVTE